MYLFLRSIFFDIFFEINLIQILPYNICLEKNIFRIILKSQQSYNLTNEQLLKRISKTVETDVRTEVVLWLGNL